MGARPGACGAGSLPPGAASLRRAHDARRAVALSRPRLVVAGAGPVGLALAAAIDGFDVSIVEASPATPVPGEEIDLRVYALSAGTRALLRDVGAWEAIDPARVAPVRRMAVFGDAASSLAFSPPAGEMLAWIVEANRLNAALESVVGG